MKIQIKLKGTSAYSPSKALIATRNDNEDYTQFEQRVWIEKAHFNSDKQVVMSIFGLKAMLDSTASFLGKKIKGQGNKTYAKLFKAGVILQAENPVIKIDNKPLKMSIL
jgi:hypothetical protein